MLHLGHFARFPASSAVTLNGVAHPGQVNVNAIAALPAQAECMIEMGE
jgi:hypothetical protein